MPYKPIKQPKKRFKNTKYKSNKAIRAIVKKLQKKVYADEDKRWIDHAITTNLVTNSGELLDVCALAGIGGGDQTNDRQGNVIHIKSISFKGQVFNAQSTATTTADATNVVRFILIKVHKNLGHDPDINQILQQDGLPPSSGPSVYSQFKYDSEVKYSKLWQRTYILGRFPYVQASGDVIPGSVRPSTKLINFHYSFKGAGLRVSYLNNAESAPLTNQIYLCVISDSSAAPHPAFVGVCRCRYIG